MRASLANAGRSRFDLADIVRQHRHELEGMQELTLQQRRVLSAIALCRTAALGGHVDVCRSCGYERPAYNSCRNRHCPKCQALEQERWIAARRERLLGVGHFHVVFTLPSQLRPLAKCYPRPIFDALFRATSQTLLELGRSRLNATLGITMVLHTWKRDLHFHPHVHTIVTAGGLALDTSCWISASHRYLFPVRIIGALLRGKMIAALRALHRRGSFDDFDDFCDPEAFDHLMSRLAHTRWNVYAKQPFGTDEHVLAYLGRYTHRVGISNSRLVAVTDTSVTFHTKNGKTTTVTPAELLRRFVQHVLPGDFKKIRHCGLYAGANINGLLATARQMLTPSNASRTPPSEHAAYSWSQQLEALTGNNVDTCPRCGVLLEHVPTSATARAPPSPTAA